MGCRHSMDVISPRTLELEPPPKDAVGTLAFQRLGPLAPPPSPLHPVPQRPAFSTRPVVSAVPRVLSLAGAATDGSDLEADHTPEMPGSPGEGDSPADNPLDSEADPFTAV
eukprot:EG_transcript_28735